jgi:hypothetical protein
MTVFITHSMTVWLAKHPAKKNDKVAKKVTQNYVYDLMVICIEQLPFNPFVVPMLRRFTSASWSSNFMALNDLP